MDGYVLTLFTFVEPL